LREFRVQALAWVWAQKWRLFFGVVALLVFALAIYASRIEPFWIEVTHHHISAPLRSPLKIAHLTDIHTYGLGSREWKLLEVMEAEQPDVIVITGDSINITSDYPGLRDLLTRLHALLGVWVVLGNHENWWPVDNEEEFYKSAGVKLLVNSSGEVRDGIWFVGFDDLYAGSPDPGKALAGVPESAYKIALFHSPIYFEREAGLSDLALAGHSHGGQVKLPFIGAPYSPPFCGRFMEGWYELRGTRMYVSRGIGTSILNVRFLCRPEIAIIELGDQ